MPQSIQQSLQNEHPNAKITVLNTDDSGPYKVYDVIIRKRILVFNENYPQDNRCICGHAYYRHFDPYEDWAAVGCKHCGCHHFVHEVGAPRISPFERMNRFGQWDVQLDDYLLQWEQLGSAVYPDIEQYLGASVQEWLQAIAPPKRSSAGYGCRDAQDDDSHVEVVE